MMLKNGLCFLLSISICHGFSSLQAYHSTTDFSRACRSMSTCSLRMKLNLPTKSTVDRRALLAGAIFSIIGFSKPKLSLAAGEPDKIAEGLLELSNQVPYEDKAIALVSDGSAVFKDIEAAITKVGGTVVKVSSSKSVSEIQTVYEEGNCIAAFVPDQKVLTQIMEGKGCECSRCGIGGTATGPFWMVVAGKTTKTGEQLEVGKGVPVYTLQELYTYRYPEQWRVKK